MIGVQVKLISSSFGESSRTRMRPFASRELDLMHFYIIYEIGRYGDREVWEEMTRKEEKKKHSEGDRKRNGKKKIDTEKKMDKEKERGWERRRE